MKTSSALQRKNFQPFESAKRLVLLGLVGAGRLYPGHGTPILTYHSIDDSGSHISVAVADFEKQLGLLRKLGYHSLSLRDLVSVRGNGNIKEKPVVITFDDGYETVHTNAWPLLQKYGFTATVFLVTNFMGKPADWEGADAGPPHPLMSWRDASELAAAGFDIEPHTCTHPYLTKIPLEAARREIAESRRLVEEKIGSKAPVFAYPYSDYDERVAELLTELGFLGAATVDFGLCDSNADMYRIKRLGSAHFKDTLAFEACLYGRYGIYRTLKRNLKGRGI